jgi:hypothetical protein
MYLRVELVSDVIAADGTGIRQHIWNGQKDKAHENFGGTFSPIKPQVGQSGRKSWNRFIIVMTMENYSTQEEQYTNATPGNGFGTKTVKEFIVKQNTTYGTNFLKLVTEDHHDIRPLAT